MGHYRKKPVVVEAKQLTLENQMELLKWVDAGGALCTFRNSGAIDITTLEGVMRANTGDWIIKGIKEEFYPCQPAIFEIAYEKVE